MRQIAKQNNKISLNNYGALHFDDALLAINYKALLKCSSSAAQVRLNCS
jgi:hypothetical protein